MRRLILCGWLFAVVCAGGGQTGSDPRSAEAQNALGEGLEKAKQLQPAREALEKAVALKPSYARAQFNLGVVLMELNEMDAAAGHLDRAVQLFGAGAEAGYAYYLRAKIYSSHEETRKAAAALTQAVKLRPDLAVAWSDLGLARKTLRDEAGAIAAYRRAVDLAPEDGIAQYRLGAEYLRAGDVHRAVASLQEADRLQPGDQSTLNALQTALRQDRQSEAADRVKVELSELLLKKDEASQNALKAVKVNNEGAQLEKAGDVRGALEKYREALRLYPEHVGMRVNYAVALLRTGQWTDGLNELHEAHLKDPGNEQIKAALRDALAQAPAGTVPVWAAE